MSDINASILPDNGTQQGTEAPAALKAEVGTPALGESTNPASESSPSASNADAVGMLATTEAATSTAATTSVDAPSASASLQSVDVSLIPADMAGNEAPTPSDLSALGIATNGPESEATARQWLLDKGYSQAQAEFATATLPTVLVTDGASHPAHGLADQIAGHVASLEGSADSLLVKIATEVRKLVAQIKSVL
jgi:hypothetical protein